MFFKKVTATFNLYSELYCDHAGLLSLNKWDFLFNLCKCREDFPSSKSDMCRKLGFSLARRAVQT